MAETAGDTTPQRPSAASRVTRGSLDQIYHERRQYDGGDDGEGDNSGDPMTTPKETLIKRASVHLHQTACTVWDENEHCYKFLPVYGTTRRQLGQFGLGVELYFQFLCQMGCVFLLMSLLTAPLLVSNSLGTMLTTESLTETIFGTMSVGNIGTCGEGNVDCPNREALKNRPINFIWTEVELKTMTTVFGTLDGVALCIFLGYALWFEMWWVSRERQTHDDLQITPGDFTIEVRGLPRKLEENHKEYSNLLKEHFEKVLKEICRVTDEGDLVHEVALVRDYKGMVQSLISQGHCLVQKQDLDVRIAKEEDPKKKERLEKTLANTNKEIVTLEAAFNQSAGKEEEELEVCNKAFVTFKKESYQALLLFEYRYAKWSIFRYFQDEKYRFLQKHRIMLEDPCEPSDIFWENMDYGSKRRLCRMCVTFLVTLVILLIALFSLFYLRAVGVPTTASTPAGDLWVLKTIRNDTCLSVCEWKPFNNKNCLSLSLEGSVVGVWNANGFTNTSTSTDQSATGACNLGVWKSEACDNSNPQHRAQWIGIQLKTQIAVKCMNFKQGVDYRVGEVELYSCKSTMLPNNTDNASLLAAWSPEDSCIGLQDLTPINTNEGSFAISGPQVPLSDTVCRRTISYTAAKEVFDEAVATKVAIGTPTEDAEQQVGRENPTMHCFCTQQQSNIGFTKFRTPKNFDEFPEKELCRHWIIRMNLQAGTTVASVAAVCIVNFILVYVFDYFVAWERHWSFTQMNFSNFWKLLLAQFINTGLVIFLVNCDLRESLKGVPLIQLIQDWLQIGNGSFDTIDFDWFRAVGAGICLTILLQVFTATTPGIITAKVVTPLLHWYYQRGLATQKALNEVYVFPEWSLAANLAQAMSVIFVIVMYSGGMPVLNLIGCLYCTMAYWMDKWCLLRGSVKPPMYTHHLMSSAIKLFPIAGLFHTGITLWTFSNQDVFPSGWWYFLADRIIGPVIGMEREDSENAITDYYAADEGERNALYHDYVEARVMDMARWGCWILAVTCIVFIVFYVVEFVMWLFLRPLVKPLILAAGCGKKPEDVGDSSTIEDHLADMTAKGMVPTYFMHDNPRYAAILARKQGSAEIDDAHKEHTQVEELKHKGDPGAKV